jgi:hypothetical protein
MKAIFESLVIREGVEHFEKQFDWQQRFVEASFLAVVVILESDLFILLVHDYIHSLVWFQAKDGIEKLHS